MNQYKVFIAGDANSMERQVNEIAKDGYYLDTVTWVQDSFGQILVTMAKHIPDGGLHITPLLAMAAERAWKSEVIDTQMLESIVGVDGEYADKEDWVDCWLVGLEAELKEFGLHTHEEK